LKSSTPIRARGVRILHPTVQRSLLRPCPLLIPGPDPKRFHSEAIMKLHLPLLSLAFATISICTVSPAQCAKPDNQVSWDTSKEQFRCVGLPPARASVTMDQPSGDKTYCKGIRSDLQKVCPAGNDQKVCKDSAKAIFDACYKSSETSNRSSPGSAASTNRNDPASCMATYQQQQQACQARATPNRAPGQPYVPDTCLSDALTAQNKCLQK